MSSTQYNVIARPRRPVTPTATTSMSLRQSTTDYTLPDRTVARDAGLLLLVPLALLGVFWLPSSVRSSLIVDYGDPSILTAYTSQLVHSTPQHLAVNLVGYGLFVSLEYVLSTLCGRKRRFYHSYATFVLVFPPTLVGLDLLVINLGIGMGLSGLVMAFYGYLPLAMSDLVSERFGVASRTDVAPLLYFVGMAVVAILGLRPALENPTVAVGTAGLLLAITLVILWYLRSIVADHDGLRATARTALQQPGDADLFLVALVLLVLFPLCMFPADPTTAGGVVNTYTHLLAFTLGFGVPFIATVVDDGVDAVASF